MSKELADNLFYFILYPDFDGWLGIVRLVFICLTLTLLLFVAIFLYKSSWLSIKYGRRAKDLVSFEAMGSKRFQKKWSQIKERAKSKKEADLKLAIIEAEGVLKETLERLGYGGQTVDEQLSKDKTSELSHKEEIMSARSVVGAIFHDPDFRVSREQVESVLSSYEKFFEKLDLF
jgi:hypothetical protein